MTGEINLNKWFSFEILFTKNIMLNYGKGFSKMIYQVACL